MCTDGRYDLDAYLADIEAIREHLGVDRWHVLGHSWGGLLAQAYANDHADHVRGLVLSSSSLGVGTDWKATKRAAFATDRRRAGLRGTARFVTFAAGLALPGKVRSLAMRRVMTETWHNYFLDPTSAPALAAPSVPTSGERIGTVAIDRRLNGPRRSANGGFAAGRSGDGVSIRA